ncbi:MAG: tetratricopeptide repeat protein, partial [Bacilli bacterium]
MNIKNVYNELSTKELKLSDFDEILELKNQCKIEMNQEYLYLSDILIIDLYINEGLYDDALTIANKVIHSIDNVVFQRIYVSLLERFIYIFIQKKNFKSAYRYAFMKRNYIDLDNIDEINRWYLEMAYIYAELNQKDKALLNLKAILSNYPDDSLKALTLSNMTKLYIDENQVEEAKKTLNDCISLVYKLGDEEGILYCNYLNAKLSILEKNYRHAKHSFQDIFKNLHTVTDDYLAIANEYVSLLIEMDLYDEAYRMCVRYLKNIEKTNNLEIKKDFYTNYLKIHVLKNKNIRDDVRGLLQAIEVLQKEIDKNEDNIINESNEDEKKIEIEDQLNKLIQKIEKTLNITLISLENDGIRNALMQYSKQLEEHISFDEATYVIFPIEALEAISEVNENYNKVLTFNYKKERLYEREISYNALKGSIVEMIISQNHQIMVDFKDSYLDVKDIITGKSYIDAGVKSLIALPLFNRNEVYGCAIYTSNSSSFINNDLMTNLRVATKILEPKLINIYFEENIRTLKMINNNIVNNVNKGVFYYNPENKMFTFSNNLHSFLGIESRKLSLDEFLGFIKKDDLPIRDIINKNIETVEDYVSEYRIIVNDKEYLISESAKPYISRDGVLKFYFGIISVLKDAIEIENEIYKRYDEEDFHKEFHEISEKSKTLDYKCSFILFRVNDIEKYKANVQLRVFDYVYSRIQKDISVKSFYLNNNDVISIIENSDIKEIEKNIKSLLSILDKGLINDDQLLYFNTKAGMVKYPTDTYNIKEIIEYLDIAISSPEVFQPFNEKIRKLYIKKKSITACVNEHIIKNNIELLYSPLLWKAEESGSLIRYNINGLENNENISKYLDDDIYINLQKIIFSKVLLSIKANQINKIYLNMSIKTLEFLLKEKFFIKDNIDKYRNIVLIMENKNVNINKVKKDLKRYEFRLMLNYETFN